MRRKRWRVLPCNKKLAAQFAETCAVPPFAAYLAVARGMTQEAQIQSFFDLQALPQVDPFALPDMQAAAQRVNRALDSFERIAVFGDYDTDGVTATAIVYSYLESHGANVLFALPDRQADGYGIHPQAVERLSGQGVQLIITVDNGISAFAAAERAQELGIDLIITDHHRAGDSLPYAVAVVNPQREDCDCPFRDYAGAGVAFQLICAIEGGGREGLLEEYGDLVAIGTVGDVVSLTGENRVLVQRGLQALCERPRPGIQALLACMGDGDKPLTSTMIAYRISPRLNAAGRMGSAESALALLLCEDTGQADAYARQLQDLNVQRQKTEQLLLRDAQQQLAKNPQLALEPVLVVAGENWHEGVLGIVAAKLSEAYNRPCFVLSIDPAKGIAKGSGRSFEGFSLFEALQDAASCLQKYGGHHLAAGLTLETGQIPALRERLRAYAAQKEIPFPLQQVDCCLNPASLTPELADALESMEPFGAGNPQPVFALTKMRIIALSDVAEGKYLRLRLQKADASANTAASASAVNQTPVQVMYFGGGRQVFPYITGDILDVAVTLQKNLYLGEARLNLHLQECKPSAAKEEPVLRQLRLYERVQRGEALSQEEARQVMPSRELCGKVYKLAVNQLAEGAGKLSPQALCVRMGDDGSRLAQVCAALDALLESGVLAKDEDGHIYAPELTQKANLEDAPVLQRIKQYL